MEQKRKELFMGILIVPFGLAIALIPVSVLIGWNLITLLLFWFVTIPSLTVYLPTIVSKSRSHLLESLTGLILFYAIMIFMIYEHYKSDYFQLMMLSCLTNVALVTTISLVKKPRKQIQ